MQQLANPIRAIGLRGRIDRAGIVLSGLCAVHCVLGIVLVGMLGLGGGLLMAPEIHRIGLGLAVVIGLFTLGLGFFRHGRAGPLVLGLCGLAMMAGALLAGHGIYEAVLTIAGVGLVAAAHVWNLRRAH